VFVSTLVLGAPVLNLVLGILLDLGVKLKGFVEAELPEEVLDLVALAVLEVGAFVLQAAVRPLHGEHGGDEAGAGVDCGGEAQAVTVGGGEVGGEALKVVRMTTSSFLHNLHVAEH